MCCAEKLEWSGTWGKVAFAQWSRRAETITEWERMPDEPHGSLESRFERLAVDGWLPPPTHAALLGSGILEIKSKGKGRKGHYRAAAFQLGPAWFVSHFFKSKHTSRYAEKQGKIAESAREEHRQWIAEQSVEEEDSNDGKRDQT